MSPFRDKFLLYLNSIATKNYKLFSKIHLWLVTGFILIPASQAEMCRKLKQSGDAELFQCPRIFEQKSKSWCCGLNTFDSYCCEWSERAKEANLSMGVLQDSFKYAVFFLALIGLVGLLVWLLCYLAGKQKLSFLHQRQVDSPLDFDHHHHHHHLQPDAPPFAPVPPYTEYPGDAYGGQQQSYTDQPPPYDQAINGLYGNAENGAPPGVAPVTVPLLHSAKVKVGDDLKNATTRSEPHLPSLAVVKTVAFTDHRPPLSPGGTHQPPFNPSYT